MQKLRSEDELMVVQAMVVRRQLLEARSWLVTRGYTPADARRLVFEQEGAVSDLIYDSASGDFFWGLLWLILGIAVSFGSYALAQSQAQETGSGIYVVFYGVSVSGLFLAFRGLRKAWRYWRISRKALRTELPRTHE